MTIIRRIRELVRRTGFDVVRYNPYGPLARWAELIHSFDADIVFDVGANAGQFAQRLRGVGYRKRIVSFEPLSTAYKKLSAIAAGDPLWETRNCAIGSSEGRIEINVAGNSDSSSILEMLPSHTRAAPETRYVGREHVAIRTLDSFFDEFCEKSDRAFLKIDTQGFERHVLDGAERSLSRIGTIQLEMSFVPLYENETLFTDMYHRLFDMGYRIVSIMEGFTNQKTGQLLQVDGIFRRFEESNHQQGEYA